MKTGTSKVNNAVLLVLSAYIAISTIAVTASGLSESAPGSGHDLAMSGAEYFFRAFTNQSNFFAGIVSVPVSVYAAVSLVGKSEKRVPRTLTALAFAACSATTLTFLTVLLGFAPLVAMRSPASVPLLYRGYLLFFHLINPVIFVAVFLMLRSARELPMRVFPFGAVPAVLYGALYTLEVVILGRWNDFYNFTHGGSAVWSVVSAAAVIAFSFIISFVLMLVRKHVYRRVEIELFPAEEHSDVH